MVAAVLYCDKGAGAILRGRGGIGRDVPGARVELGRIGDKSVDLGHGGKLITLDIGSATGNQQAGIGIGATRAADRLPCLAYRLAGHCAAVDDHQVLLPGQHGADLLAFGNVETASE